MPIRTSVLDNGNFVCSPEVPARAGFSQYLVFADRLLGQWRKVQDDWNLSPFSAALAQRKKELQRVVEEFVATFRERYALKAVERDSTFWPVSRFLAVCRPVREPLRILHCDRDMPLHTVQEFSTPEELARLNAALSEDAPLRWWQTGPHGLPCYLFGDRVWELRPAETAHSEPGMVVAFLEFSEKDRLQRDRLRAASVRQIGMPAEDYIPEKVRVEVWRRARGKCEECGSHDGLDFASIGRAGRSTDCRLQDTQLLCSRCREKVGAAQAR
jgi:hypothetical protein